MLTKFMKLPIVRVPGAGLCVEVDIDLGLGRKKTVTALFSTALDQTYIAKRLYDEISQAPLIPGHGTHDSGAYYVGTMENYYHGVIPHPLEGGDEIAVIVSEFSKDYPVELILGVNITMQCRTMQVNNSDGFVILNGDLEGNALE